MPEKNDYNLTYPEVAKLLGRSERTIQRYVKQGRLSKREVMSDRGTVNYFSESEVEQLKKELSPDGREPRGDTTGRQLVALQTALVTFQRQLEKKEEQLEAKERTINELNREVGKLEGQMKDAQKLSEEKEKLETLLAVEEKKHERAILFTNLIYVLLMLLGVGFLISLPYLQNLITR